MKTRKNIKCKSKKKYLVKNARTFKKQNNKYMSKRNQIFVGGSTTNAQSNNKFIMPEPITNENIRELVSTYLRTPALFLHNPIEEWNVSKVEDMKYMFAECTNFNEDISNWNVSNVINMNFMFAECINFNQDLSKWYNRVQKVKNMSFMFYKCTNFNQDLSKWYINSDIDISYMFYECPAMKEEFKIKLGLFYPNIEFDNDNLKLLQQPPLPHVLIEKLKKYIKELISINKETNDDIEKEKNTLFNMCVNYLLTYFEGTELTSDTNTLPHKINELFTKLITINYNAYTHNKKNLLELPILDPEKHKYNLIDLHGGISDNEQNIFFQLPKNVTIIFLTRLSYLGCSKLEPICNKISGDPPLIEKYIALLKNKDTKINGIEKTDEIINLLSTFKDAVFYYGEQYCIDLKLKKSTEADQKNGMGMYNSNEGCYPLDTKTYNISLSNLLQSEEYKETGTNHTIILTSCRSLMSKNIKYSNILKFYEEITQAINNTDNLSGAVAIYNDTQNDNPLHSLNTRSINNQPVALAQGFNSTKSNIPINSATFNTTSLFKNLTQKTISENTIIIIKKSDTGKDDTGKDDTRKYDIITIKAIKTEYKKILDRGDRDQPNYDSGYTYLSTIIPRPSKTIIDTTGSKNISLQYKQYQRIIELIFSTDSITKEGILTIMDTVHLRIKIWDYIAYPDSFTDKPIGSWDVSRVTDMSKLFNVSNFNENLSNWDVRNVKKMGGMFYGCTQFNQDLSKWNVSNVKDMNSMFYGCTQFNQDLSNWIVSKVEDMKYMFAECTNFNQDLSKWNVSNVKDMYYMFAKCRNFNQDLSNWNVSNVEKMDGMFYDCRSFIGTGLDKWGGDKVLNVKYMSYMFYGCTQFNQDLSKWNVSKETDITDIDIFEDSGVSNNNKKAYMPRIHQRQKWIIPTTQEDIPTLNASLL